MLEALNRPLTQSRPAKSRQLLAWGAGSFSLGGLLSVVAMLVKPPALEFRFAETLLAAMGVLLASGGLLAVMAGVVAAEAKPVEEQQPARSVRLAALAPALLQIGVSLLALRFVINRAIVGRVPAPYVTLGVVVPVLILLVLWGALRLAEQLGFRDADPPGIGPPGTVSPGTVSPGLGPLGAGRFAWLGRWWVTLLSVLLYVPALGAFGMIDCWEPQYSEVAREMLARHDWISLWWGDQSWFWSKPILDFWLQGVSFGWFGLDPGPEAMLRGVEAGRVPLPEWAARLPIFASALAAQLVLERGVARHLGGRAARLGTLILVTCPYWFFLARQTMVDMVYAAPFTAAFGFLLLAAAAGEDERVQGVRIESARGSCVLSGYHLVLGSIAALSLVQIFYLLSRHVSLEPIEASRWVRLDFHLDEVWAGSNGNCTLPGNAPCAVDHAASRTPLQPAWSALCWTLCLGALLWLERRERRVRQLYYLAAWTMVALAFMGKAAPGLVLPPCAFGAWLLLRGRLGELRHAQLLGFVLILACVAAPWFVQEYARHGRLFFDRLFMHDMYNRAFGHVHDTNRGVDTSFRYYVWQLGYGLFPWSGVLAAGTLYCVGKSAASGTDERFRSVTQLCVAWQLACFGLFSIAGTKFHHYILPLVPAAAVLGGAWLSDLWQREKAPAAAALGLGAAVVTALVAGDLAGGGTMPGAVLLLQLFTYEYSRPWPATLDYRLVLGVFGALAALSCLLLGLLSARARRWVLGGLCGVGVGFGVWAMFFYLIEVSPHWSQRETISLYYKTRASPEELLVAYRQNWMGENFYTSNHVATFKSAGKPFESWVAERRAAGQRVLFFTTEHNTIAQLKREVGAHDSFELLTTPAQNNKFVLARVVL